MPFIKQDEKGLIKVKKLTKNRVKGKIININKVR